MATLTHNGMLGIRATVAQEERDLLDRVRTKLRERGVSPTDEFSDGRKRMLARDCGISVEKFERCLDTLLLRPERKPEPAVPENFPERESAPYPVQRFAQGTNEESPFGEDDPHDYAPTGAGRFVEKPVESLVEEMDAEAVREAVEFFLRKKQCRLGERIPRKVLNEIADRLGVTESRVRGAVERLRKDLGISLRRSPQFRTLTAPTPADQPGDQHARQTRLWEILEARGISVHGRKFSWQEREELAAVIGVAPETVRAYLTDIRKPDWKPATVAAPATPQPAHQETTMPATVQQASPVLEGPQAQPAPAPRTEVLEGTAPVPAPASPAKATIALVIAQGLEEASRERPTEERLAALLKAADLVTLAA